MNLSGRFYVKSTYIRAAKDNWVLCDVRLLTDDVDTFLCIKSLPPSVHSDEDQTQDPETEKKGRYASEKRPKTTSFTALCNLSEYKSCSVRTVTVNDRDSFAIRLVPSGVIGNKQLLIASVDENEITTWLAICKASIGKKSRNSQNRDNMSTAGTLSKAGSFMSLKPMSNSIDADCDDGLLDNEVYEAYSSEDKIPALLEEAGDWMKLHLNQPECYLRLTEERLEVLDAITEKPVQWFPYLLIRRFGAANGVLRVDAGRRCSSGDGRFFFRCSPPNGQPVDMLVTQIRQLALEAKQRLRRNQMAASNLELNGQQTSGRTVALTPDGTMERTSVSNTETDSASPYPGTLPRARSKRQKQAAEVPSDRTTRTNGFLTNGSPPVTSESVSDPSSQSPGANSAATNSEDGELVHAVPARARKQSQNQAENTSFYDNIPRPPRKGTNLPGAVNVLPLPARARPNHQATTREPNGESHLFQPEPKPRTPVDPRLAESSFPTLRPSPVSPSRNGHLSKEMTDDLPCAPPPPPPPHANEVERKSAELTRTRTPSACSPGQEEVTCLSPPPQPNHPMPPPIPTLAATISTSINPVTASTVSQTPSAGSAAVMRVPPFTAPKPIANQTSGATKLPACSSSSPQENKTVATEPNPVPLSKLLSTKVSSASMYLRGPHPQMKKEPIHCTQLNFTPTPGVSSLINRINSDWKSPRMGPNKTEPSSPVITSSTVETVFSDDPKHYLNELDSVIKELCEANEEAVRATREAARRRHQVGWPAPYKPPCTGEKINTSNANRV
ncbi:hypothetical protein CRM22_008079 [Opisthorchis felineus]|uniref:IRS-type PTB domain-containing protein n=2 Tax=Opisthorchis felineus TaxID=147828 RepID=A0A4S2LDB1_OPIFE|nr:hypothetical protein CRM22_008079 [Opisthorchis felineus]